MKKMEITKTEIKIEYKTDEQATKIANGLPVYEQENVTVTSNILTYDLHNCKTGHIYYMLKFLFKRSLFKSEYCKIDENSYTSHNGIRVIDNMDAIIDDNCKLFKLTLINERGTIGKYGFGCWQYGRILGFREEETTFSLHIRNSNMGEKINYLNFEDDLKFLIEIGEIQF